MPDPLRFRQIHLDFHTNGEIPGVGTAFDKKQWQEVLQTAAVDSVTLFGRCHHGYAYYPSKVAPVHPHLDFDLLGAQIEASHEVGVLTPVYITVGWDEWYAAQHPEAMIHPPDGLDPLVVGWKRLAFEEAYMDYVCEVTEEIMKGYEIDGLFYDIVGLTNDISLPAQAEMRAQGMDPSSGADRHQYARQKQERYFQRIKDCVDAIDPTMRVFHNAGHIPKGDQIFLNYASHLEIESLPTGGWGYDHMPLSAKYTATLDGVDVMGMTGKFHTSWGEFGGFKHPNALRYECAHMLAYGCRCSVGDQLHPNGKLNEDTYERIGIAYREVREKEDWVRGARPVNEIGLLSIETLPGGTNEGEHFGGRHYTGDIGASRMLLERQIPFDVIDTEAEFSSYSVIILPDSGRLGEDLTAKLQAYLNGGGKLLLSGDSGLALDEDRFVFDGIGEFDTSAETFDMEYLKLDGDWVKTDPYRLMSSPFVINGENRRLVPAEGAARIGEIHNPYFSRTVEHFCSHQHAPDAGDSGFPAGVISADGSIFYLAVPIFTQYADRAQILYRDFLVEGLKRFLGKRLSIETSLPSAGRVSLTEQAEENRYVFHMLYAQPVKRGDNAMPKWNLKSIEVIEDIPTLHEIEVSLQLAKPVKAVVLVPDQLEIPFEEANGRVEFTVPFLECHQMVELRT